MSSAALPAVDWREELVAAEMRLTGVVAVTPVRANRALNEEAGAQVFSKDEGVQTTGSFKLRGAWNALAARKSHACVRGVVTYSSGNFGRALAYAASSGRLPVVVVTPDDTPKDKLAGMRTFGATIVMHDPAEDRMRIAARVCAARGMVLIPPYDDPHVIAGQATTGAEFQRQVRALDALVVPVSGGGLLAGCALSAQSSPRRLRVFGVEPEALPKTRVSLRNGRRVKVPPRPTIADALRVTRPGAVTFPVIANLVEDVVTVDDAQVAGAMTAAHRHFGPRYEPGGAAALAAVLSHLLPPELKRIGVILTGCNISARRYQHITSAAAARRQHAADRHQ
jgi:threonine dehydratase